MSARRFCNACVGDASARRAVDAENDDDDDEDADDVADEEGEERVFSADATNADRCISGMEAGT